MWGAWVSSVPRSSKDLKLPARQPIVANMEILPCLGVIKRSGFRATAGSLRVLLGLRSFECRKAFRLYVWRAKGLGLRNLFPESSAAAQAPGLRTLVQCRHSHSQYRGARMNEPLSYYGLQQGYEYSGLWADKSGTLNPKTLNPKTLNPKTLKP